MAAVAGIVAVQWCTGYPELLLDGCVLVTLVVALMPGQSITRRLAILGAGFALGTALAAIQLVPLAEAVAQSTRVDETKFWSALREQQASWTLRTWAHTWRWSWLIAPCALGALLAPSRRRVGWALAAGWAVFALNFPFRLLYLVPPYDGVRTPFGWSHLGPLFIGSLVAAALASMQRRFGKAAAAVLGATISLQAAYGIISGLTPPTFIRQRPHIAQSIEDRLAVLESLRTVASEPGRWISSEGSHLGLPITAQLPFLIGWEPALRPRWLLRLIEKQIRWTAPEIRGPRSISETVSQHSTLFRMLGVGYVLLHSRFEEPLLASGFRRVTAVPPSDVLLYRPPLPRARIVPQIQVEPDGAATLAAISAPTHDPATTSFVETPLTHGSNRTPDAPTGSTTRTRIVADHPERIVIKATLAEQGFLVLADTYYPGWNATIDKVPTTIYRADQLFRGVALPPGRHVIAFDYRPASLRYGAAISMTAFLVLIAALIGNRRLF